MPVFIMLFAELAQGAGEALLIARLSAILHALRVGSFAFRVERFIDHEGVFELLYKSKTYFAGVERGGGFVVKAADGGTVPEALVQDLRIAAERSNGFRGLYVGNSHGSIQIGLTGQVSFKASW
jgi:hypothetical protein